MLNLCPYFQADYMVRRPQLPDQLILWKGTWTNLQTGLGWIVREGSGIWWVCLFVYFSHGFPAHASSVTAEKRNEERMHIWRLVRRSYQLCPNIQIWVWLRKLCKRWEWIWEKNSCMVCCPSRNQHWACQKTAISKRSLTRVQVWPHSLIREGNQATFVQEGGAYTFWSPPCGCSLRGRDWSFPLMQRAGPSIIREGWMDWLNKEVAEPRDMQFLAQVPSEVVPCQWQFLEFSQTLLICIIVSSFTSSIFAVDYFFCTLVWWRASQALCSMT